MGLLRKAAGAAARDETGPLQPILPPPDKRAPTRGGLLQRTKQLRASPLPLQAPAAPSTVEGSEGEAVAYIPVLEVRELRPAAEIIRELEAAIESLQDGVELPSRLFTTVSRILSIRRGALLLYDPLRLVYAPWASLGYDQTTLHRLRVPLGANDSFNALANGASLSVSDPALLAPYQSYFSTREFSSLSRILLTPFIAADTLIGVLLVTDLALPDLDEGETLECLSAVARAGAPAVAAARARKLATSDATRRPEPASLEEEVTRFVRALPPGDQKAVFFSLSLEDYVQRILSAHEHLDPFRLHEDIQYFLAAFLADVGIAFPVRPGVFIMGIQALPPSELDLLLHQLTRYLNGLFGGNGQSSDAPGPRIIKSRIWPEDGDGIRALVDFLSS